MDQSISKFNTDKNKNKHILVRSHLSRNYKTMTKLCHNNF